MEKKVDCQDEKAGKDWGIAAKALWGRVVRGGREGSALAYRNIRKSAFEVGRRIEKGMLREVVKVGLDRLMKRKVAEARWSGVWGIFWMGAAFALGMAFLWGGYILDEEERKVLMVGVNRLLREEWGWILAWASVFLSAETTGARYLASRTVDAQATYDGFLVALEVRTRNDELEVDDPMSAEGWIAETLERVKRGE